jgi:putative two-component system response regulator
VSAVRALLVEDNPGDTRLITEMLADVESDVELEYCDTLACAIERLARNSIEVVVLDLTLPDSQGIDTFARLQEAAPHVAVIILTGNSNTHEALRTVEEGAQDFLVKGRVDGEILTRSIDYARSRKDAEIQLRASQARLQESNAQLLEMVYEVAEAMGRVVEARDPYTQGHQERVARVAKLIAEEMGLPKDDIDAVEMAGLIHDIGKMCIPAEILSRPGQLTDIERSLIRQHPQSSYDILKDIAFPWPVADIALQHHERLDGSGYPLGLTGDEMLLAGRILAVADVTEAMSSHRPYRPALGLDLAIVELTEHPELYDPIVAASCKRLYEAGNLDL